MYSAILKTSDEKFGIKLLSNSTISVGSESIKLSNEIGTEIEDLEVLREQLKYGMTFEEATQILGDKYIETVKGTEDVIYDWYDKKENHMEILFEDGIIVEILPVMHSY